MPTISDKMSYYDRGQKGYGINGGGSHDPWMSQTPPGDRYVREPHTGRYVRTPPARLPELSTPNGNDTYRSTEDLRGQHFDRIPPVRPAFENPQPRESPNNWRLDTRSNYSDDVAPYSQPQPYNYNQPMYPVAMGPQLPGAMYYPAPMMVPHGYAVPSAYMHPQPHMFAPPAPSHTQPQRQKRVRYDDRPTYYSQDRSGYDSGSPFIRPLPEPEPSPRFSNSNSQPIKSSPQTPSRRQYLIPTKNKPTVLETKATHNLESRPDFANEVVNSLISEVLGEDIIPDLLIDILSQQLDSMSKDHPYYIPSFDAAIDFLEDAVPPLVREVVVEASKEMVTNYLSVEPSGANVSDQIADNLLNEVLSEEVGKVVRESVHDLAANHLEKASAFDVASSFIDEHLQEVLPGIVEDAKREVMVDLALDTEVIDPVIEHLAREVAIETLDYYHEKAQHIEHKEVMRQSQKRVFDGVILDHLLSSIAATAVPPGESEQEHAKQITEHAMLTIMLEQFLWIPSEMEATVKNKPIGRHHERAFMEVALDAITEELCATLDEDMADYDDYEQGLWNPTRERPPEWALYTT